MSKTRELSQFGNEIIVHTDGSIGLDNGFSGNLGIGTTAPDLKLHVDGTNGYPASSGTTPVGHIAIRAKSSSSSHGATIGIADAAPWGTWIQAQDAGNLATAYPLLLNPNGGNVGIGTQSPGAKLDVRGEVRLDSGGSTSRSIYFRNQDSSSTGGGQLRSDQYLSLHAGNGSGSPTQYVTIKPGGNVGIGTADPTDKLDIQGADNGLTIRSSSANRPIMKLINGSSTMLTLSANGTYAAIGDGSDVNKYMSFKGSNVGIGTTDPSYKLHALGDSSLTDPESNLGVYYGFLNSNSNVNTGSAILLGSNNNSGAAVYAQRIGANNEHKLGIQVRNSAGSSTTHLTVMGSGNVGIGTGAPSALFDLETPGNTIDGGYYSTMTINNTGSGTWSRLRFDRSNSAKWGISLGTDDKLKISNLDLNGGGGANDGALVIDNANQVSINSQTAYAKFYVSGGVMAHAFENGGNWRSLGSFGTGSGTYCHVKTNLTYNSYRMTTFRATGFYPYNAIGHGYLGCYTYGATPGSPYGQANLNYGNHAVAHGQYYASDSSLVLVWNWGTTYNGFWLEYISTGGAYGNIIDVNVVAATNSNSDSGVY